MEEIKITVETEQIEALLCAISELADGLTLNAFQATTAGIFKEHKDKTEEENAAGWIQSHYATAAGTIRLIAAASSIVSTALVNDEITIKIKE